jgi:hypothetical protein
MLLCFRFGGAWSGSPSAFSGASDSTVMSTLATQTLVNNFVVWVPNSASTAFTHGFVNYFYYGTGPVYNDASSVPIIYRVNSKFDTADSASGTRLAVFFDRLFTLDTLRTLDSSVQASYPCAVAPHATVTCMSRIHQTPNGVSVAAAGLWPTYADYTVNQRVESTLTPAATINNLWIPVIYNQANSVSPKNIHIVTGSADSTSGHFVGLRSFALISPLYIRTTATA